MLAVVGPILLKEGRYAFDLWTAEEGLSRGYPYHRIEDAHYARNAEIRSRRRAPRGATMACGTLEEFTLAMAEREAPFQALVAKLDKTKPVTLLVRRGDQANFLVIKPARN